MESVAKHSFCGVRQSSQMCVIFRVFPLFSVFFPVCDLQGLAVFSSLSMSSSVHPCSTASAASQPGNISSLLVTFADIAGFFGVMKSSEMRVFAVHKSALFSTFAYFSPGLS
ncbi:hypothetical protein [Ruegeria jejuensis]|uniref:hypothetical protein n=1 Tax=Ruegeria jejuensis TaxID=3233338 RepID=UPI00355AE4B4